MSWYIQSVFTGAIGSSCAILTHYTLNLELQLSVLPSSLSGFMTSGTPTH